MRCLTAKLGVVVAAVGLLAALPPTAEASDTPHPDLVGTTAATFTPNLVSTGFRPIAYSINQAGSSMIVGGRFNRVENAARTVQYNRQNVFAFDATTGAVSPSFDPNVDGQVWSVLGNGDDVYIAGEFTNVDGVARPSVAKLSLSTGLLDTDFNPKVAGGAAALTIVAGRELVEPVELEPVSIAQGEGDLFTRWGVRTT